MIKGGEHRKTIFPFFVIIVLVSLGVVIFLLKQMNNKTVIDQPKSQKVEINNPTIVTTQVTASVEQPKEITSSLIQGKIVKISSKDPAELEVSVDIEKNFPDQGKKEIVKTVIIKSGIEFVLHNMEDQSKTDRDVVIELSSLKEGDIVAIWIEELTTDILKLNQLTATKVIKLQ